MPLPQLGDARIDEDHQKLEALVEALLAAAPAHSVAALDALYAHAAAHFADEDVTLREHPSGNAQCHLDEHAAVLTSLREVRAVITSEDSEAGANAALLERLCLQLLQWLPGHVLEMDAAVAAARIQTRWGGGARVQIHRSPPQSSSIPL